jgi:hypothetical protein
MTRMAKELTRFRDLYGQEFYHASVLPSVTMALAAEARAKEDLGNFISTCESQVGSQSQCRPSRFFMFSSRREQFLDNLLSALRFTFKICFHLHDCFSLYLPL